MLPTSANGQPAAAEYVRGECGGYRPYGVVVLTVRGAGISRVSSFGDPGLVRLFGFPGDGVRPASQDRMLPREHQWALKELIVTLDCPGHRSGKPRARLTGRERPVVERPVVERRVQATLTGEPGPGAQPEAPGPAWHALDAGHALRALRVSAQDGLSSAEAAARAGERGPNRLTGGKAEPRWRAFVRQYQDPMQLVLLGAAPSASRCGSWAPGCC